MEHLERKIPEQDKKLPDAVKAILLARAAKFAEHKQQQANAAAAREILMRKLEETKLEENNRRTGRRKSRIRDNARLAGIPNIIAPSSADYIVGPENNIAFDWYLLEMEEDGKISTPAQQNVPADSHRVPKVLKERLKKGHINDTFLRSVEEQVRQIIYGSSSQETSMIVNVTGDYQNAKAQAFIRWIIHQLAVYYNVSSHTEELEDGARVAFIEKEMLSTPALPPIWSIVSK